MGNIYLVRHGQASFGARDYDQLSPLGFTQSDLLGRWLAQTRLSPGRVICGRLKRHRQTAEACLATWQNSAALDLVEDGAFDEFNHQEILVRAYPEFSKAGRLERFIGEQENGRQAFQAKFAESVARWVAGEHDDDYSESWAAFGARCYDGMLRAARASNGTDVWVFTSGGPVAAITQQVLAVPDDNVLDLNWSVLNSSVTQFVYRDGRARLSQFNNVAHLAIAGRAELISYR